MNKVALVGRLTKDVELRGDGERAFAMFTVAANRPFKNKDGEYDADFIRCKAFGKTAEFIEKWFEKGDPIGVTGWIQTGSYTDNNGNKVFSTDVVVENAEFVGGAKEKNNGEYDRKSSKSKRRKDYDDDDDEYERPKKKRRADDDEDYERPKKKRKPELDEEDEDYPF